MKLPEIKLSYSNPIKKAKRQRTIKAADTVAILRNIFDPKELELREQMVVLYLNNSLDLIGFTRHSVGGITTTVFDLRLILAGALKSLSTGLILCHNHPSGVIVPSASDKNITSRLKEAAKIMDIQLLDHIILTKDAHFSFAEEGLNGSKDGHAMNPSENGQTLQDLMSELQALNFKNKE